MLTQQIFRKAIEVQSAYLEGNIIDIERELLHTIPNLTGFASIITGIRRCGKSTLQLQVKKRFFPNEGLFLNFEDPRLASMESSDFDRLHTEILERETKILFFDEIQIIPAWEIFVNQLLRENFVVYITGSNASLLSKELGTHLTGRHLSTELFPFSYTEFLKFEKLENTEEAFKKYSEKGGMPDYLRTSYNQYLNNLLDDILIRDIAIRQGIRDVNSLRQLAVYLLSNIGNLLSANKLKGMFGIKSTTTLLDYFSYLQDAYLLEFVPLYDYSVKKQLRNPQKIYATDLGIYHQNKIVFSPNEGHILENMVYLHLRRQRKEIFYFKGKGECDFVCTERGLPKELYQVCTELNGLNLEREVNGLFEAMRNFNTKEAYIITQNQSDSFKKDGLTIKVMPAWQWMGKSFMN